MGLFDGIEEAKVFEDGRKLPEGDHVVVIDKVIQRRSGRDGADLYIVEYIAEESATADKGGRYSWVQNMKDRNVALPATKQFALAAMGADKEKDPEYYRRCEDQIKAALEASITQQFFTGKRVRVSVKLTKTKQNHDFLKHTFRPAA